jgi:eukaryotic-like serine/threonine-protein kinase
MTAATELAPGTVLDGTYRIVELLGEGGMGAVYVAELVRLPKRVALKVLHVAADEGAKARFRREAEIAAKVHHPRVVEVLDYNFLEDGSPYLVMELLEGNDLRHRLSQGAMGSEEVIAILTDTASALEQLHAIGIVHRDLKPENIFLAQEGDELRAKVLDFGISKMLGAGTALTADQSVLGTPAYMAPEQVTGQNATLDPRTDQFALAAVAFEMLAGRPAFQGDTVIQLFHRILTEPAPVLSGTETKGPVDEVLAKALGKSMDDRYPNVRAFVAALGEALDVAPPRGSRADPMAMAETVASGELPAVGAPASDPAPQARSRRARLAGLAAVGVAAILVLGIALWQGQDQGEDAAAEAAGGVDTGTAPGTEGEAGHVATGETEIDTGPEDGTESSPETEDEPSPETEDEPETEGGPEAPPANQAPPKPRPRAAARRSGQPSDPAALELLRTAEARLAAGDPGAAIRDARKSLQTEQSMAARATMAKAHCTKRDLGLAKAMARGLRGAPLRDAKRHCLAEGIEL